MCPYITAAQALSKYTENSMLRDRKSGDGTCMNLFVTPKLPYAYTTLMRVEMFFLNRQARRSTAFDLDHYQKRLSKECE